ncbi:MAG: NADH:ubiquinone oxidoreductase subunit J [Methanomassiliicoccales archaeon PtaU1.Bin124]|nr:MAG: NADH:ubiquinone oxidoreductase subunit J [Methanomassiliicoccales archaeon PtaU1.Bin124]
MSDRITFGPRGVLAAKLVVVGAMLVVMLYAVYQWMGGIGTTGMYEILSDATKQIGNLLFDQWGAAVLVMGLVLFVAMLGGVFISQEEDE